MGPDRMHHAFWKYFDTNHKKYVKGNPYENEILLYYKYIDKEIGKLLATVCDDTAVFIVSDHGAKSMKGCFCINEWLIREGYLSIKKYPESPAPLSRCVVDLGKTKAWAEGGYHANIYLNLEGREPHGIIPKEKFNEERQRLLIKIRNIAQQNGKPMNTIADSPEGIYKEKCMDQKPDIMVFLDDLNYRAAGTIGHDKLFLDENDTGPDDAVHDWHGVLAMKIPGKSGGFKIENPTVMDIAPTILSLMGISAGREMVGKVIEW
jgi:predicted AlkP superfamily phosphohydrolase/phosphomutase